MKDALKAPWQLDIDTHTLETITATIDTQIATHAANNDAHALTASAISATPKTLLTAITHIFTALYVVTADTDQAQSGIAALVLNESQIVLTSTGGTCVLALSADGVLTIVATGTDTYTTKLLPIWI